jgi:RHS repeat-associated protein
VSGWRLITSEDGGYATFTSVTESTCATDGSARYDIFKHWQWTGPDGTVHTFNFQTQQYYPTACDENPPAGTPNGDSLALDASGYHMYVTNYDSPTVYAPDGTQVYPSFKDSNGNYYSSTGGGISWPATQINNSAIYPFYLTLSNSYIDSAGRTLITVSENGDNAYLNVLNSTAQTSPPYTVVTELINVCSSWPNNGVYDHYALDNGTGQIRVISEIDLPDGTKYSFTYDGNPTGYCGFGNLTSMTLPTGAQINYSFSNPTNGGAGVGRWVQMRTTPDSSTPWTYTPSWDPNTCPSGSDPSYFTGCQQYLTLSKPSGDSEVYTFNIIKWGGAWPTTVQYYGAGNLLATQQQTWQYFGSTDWDCTSSSTSCHAIKVSETTTLPTPGGANVNRTTQYVWDLTYGNVTQRTDWNFYSGSLPASPDKTMTTLYYQNGNVVNRPATVTTTDKNSSTVSQTINSYDGTSTTPANGMANHDDNNYGANFNARGNLTQVQRLIGGGAYVTKTMTYDSTGQMLSETDWSNGNLLSYDYADNFFTDQGNQGLPQPYTPSQPTNAYLHKITQGSLITTFGYYWGTGQKALSTDPNTQTTYLHFYDSLNRPTSTKFPDGGWNYSVYTGQNQVDVGTAVTSSALSISCNPTGGDCRHDQTLLDGLGRVSSKILVSDPDGQTTANTIYDSNGRLLKVSNPYHSTSDPTYGLEINAYDGLDRLIQTTHADGHISDVYYGVAVGSVGGATSQLCSTSSYGIGYPVLKIDEAGNKLQSWTDGFGRLIEADEPDSNNNLTVGTCYSYDLNNNLTEVVQGSETRSFTYDTISRVTSKTEPESGTTCFYYATSVGSCGSPSSGGLCSGDLSEVCLRVRPAPNQPNPNVTVTTTYSYDQFNRLTTKAYSDGVTPTAHFRYDQTSQWGFSLGNSIGRLVEAYTDPGNTWAAEIFGYDPMGRVLLNNQCTPANCGTSNNPVNYTYDLLGDMESYTNGAGVTVTQSPFSGAGRLTAVTSSLADSNHPGTLLSNVHYNALGETISATLGNGAVQTLGYAPRGWPQSVSVASQSTGTPGQGTVTINGSEQSHTQNGYSTSQGPNSPSGGTDGGGGSAAWGNPGYITAYDGVSATASGTVPKCSDIITNYLEATGYFGAIPSNATITGVVATIYRRASVNNPLTVQVYDNYVKLIKGGVISGTDHSGLYAWSTSETAFTYGSSTDLWGVALTPGDVNAGNFGLAFQADLSNASSTRAGSESAVVDYISITVYYSVPPVTTYDSGSVTITVNGTSTPPVSYGSSSTKEAIASQLATSISAFGFVTASTGGTNVISIQSTTNGSSTNYSLSASSQSNYPQWFNPPSFTASPSGANLTGGTGAPGTLYSFSLGYGAGNSNVTLANDSVNGNWVFTYDYLNRLSTSNQNNGQEAFSYTYDRFGNRLTQTVTAGSGGNLNLSYSGNNNRMDGYSYDAAGNLLSDGLHNYTYDAENRPIAVDGGTTASYFYDAEGRRVQKTTGAGQVEYLYDLNGQVVSEMSSAGSWNRGEIFANGQHLATYSNGTSGTTYFDHTDWLGTERARSNMADTNCETITNMPFGDWQSVNGSCADASPLHFTGQQRDGETSVDYFRARHYTSQFGRFMSPDPLGGHLGDPQSLNHYAYVRNNPLNRVDPTGMDDPGTLETEEHDNSWWYPLGSPLQQLSLVQAGRNFNGGSLQSPVDFEFTGTACNPRKCTDYVAVFDTWEGYANWHAGIQAEINSVVDELNSVTKAFRLIATNQGLDPSQAFAVTYRYSAMVYNVSVSVPNDPFPQLNQTAAQDAGGWPDPVTFMHGGADSYYFGSLLWNSGHLVNSTATVPMNAHIDPFGPWSPLHYLIQIPSKIIPGRDRQSAICTVSGGCVLD